MIARQLLRHLRLGALLLVSSAQGEGPMDIPPEVDQPNGVLRVVNGSRYALIDLRLDERQKLDWGASLPVGSKTDFVVKPGKVEYAFGAGFWSGLVRGVWFGSVGRTTVAPGQTVTVTVSNPTLEQLLTDFSFSADWEGLYFDARDQLHTRRLHFNAAGIFTLSTDGEIDRAGRVQLAKWPDAAQTITFRLCDPDCGPEIELQHPFQHFAVGNGPQTWPLIEYFRQ